MGVVSLVLGFLGGGLLGVIFGHMGLAANRRGEANNRGIALAGLIVNYAMLGVVALILIVVVVAASVSPSSTPTHTSGFATRGTETTAFDDLASHPLDSTLAVSTYWYDLTVGDCITSFYSDEGSVDGDYVYVDPEVVPCSEPHYGEVYALARIGGDEPPSEDTFVAHYEQLCEGSAFNAYVGVSDYYESSIYFDVLYPNDSAWWDGGREMVCVLYEEDESTVGSLKGSGL